MTKLELIKQLEAVPDEAEIRIELYRDSRDYEDSIDEVHVDKKRSGKVRHVTLVGPWRGAY